MTDTNDIITEKALEWLTERAAGKCYAECVYCRAVIAAGDFAGHAELCRSLRKEMRWQLES